MKLPDSSVLPSKLHLQQQGEVCCGKIKLFSFLWPAFLRLVIKACKGLPEKNKRQRKLLLPIKIMKL
jgi:hypothetical protein